MASTGEDHLLSWLRRRARGAGGELQGDDAALLPAGGPWAVTVDTQIEGVHFPSGLDPRLVARRLLAVNLSDLAAVGAEPRYALLALAAPKGFDHRSLLSAVVAACRRFQVELVGGDLARHPSLTAVMTLVGRRPPGGRWVERSGARPGDRLWLGGTVGESAAGRWLLARGARTRGPHAASRRGGQGPRIELPPAFSSPRRLAGAGRRAVRRHLVPHPQLELGRWLGRRRRAAAIDLSDGLSLDLHRLCRASGVGARIEAAALPAPPGFEALARALELEPLELMTAGGEDYVLLFALPSDEAPPEELGATPIGVVTRRRQVLLAGPEGSRPLTLVGWDHLTAPEVRAP